MGNQWKQLYKTVVIIGVFVGGIGHPSAAEPDNRIFADLLKQYVHDGVVDYAGFKTEESSLDAYLKILEALEPAQLNPKERFAFYVNAYNAWTIKLILTGYPGVESIKDLGSVFKSPWKKKFVRLNGQMVTLDNIEHDILRKDFQDPRVHFAVNCASKSCPPLLSEPFRGEILDIQLDGLARFFINDPHYNRFENGTLYVSRIFKWFKEDFDDDVVGFFLKYADDALRKRLTTQTDVITVKYLDYDWSLNGA